MLRSRVIPVLLVRDKGLVKTVKFKNDKYVGDPINAVRIFNEKEVDELIVLDIDATAQVKEPNYDLIENIASECRMPLCYGGGVNNLDQILKILSLGVEKVALSAAPYDNEGLIEEAARRVGSQSIAVVLDVRKRRFGGYQCMTHNATVARKIEPVDYARKLANLGAGEIIINSIDRDGTMSGYDTRIIQSINSAVPIPVTAVGGAGSMQDVRNLADKEGIIGCAAGSIFVFKGKYRAVLINYQNLSQ
ncbi:MAG: AglZ/HisF2 family acetamidino modification protein [Pseudomonadota bacterium]